MEETTPTQNEVVENPTTPVTEIPSGPKEVGTIEGFAKFMDDGGVFMWIILFMWVFGIIISVERFKTLFAADVDGTSLMNEIKKDVLTNEVQNAIQNCSTNKSYLANVMRNGLKRANQSKEQIQDTLESSMLEVMPHVEKRLGYLALIANVSTLIGLLGTIYGLIQSFAAVASADPSSKAELLALGISKAMNTTAFGLISAISIMVIHSILTTKAEKIMGDLEHFSVKLVDLLSTRKGQKQEQNQNAA
ncbi:MAG: transporter [Halobacteriovoraceae bacterium]|nr:transporter [Halobacteriovoraceae bacterium]|tara:strand:+ start:3600 stop:4343 length:744 start_codon:yes stop_codon:yes gene_type:complete